MITLYQLHWSHYVEKVRWALDYKQLDWSAVDVDPFTKRQMRHLDCRLALDSGQQLYAVPTIHDHATGAVVGDSSRILDYLESTYPAPALFPSDVSERKDVTRWMLWLDSALGLAARRVAYTQIAIERPSILASLFLPDMASAGGFKGYIGGTILAGVLSRRFRFRHNRKDRVIEQLEHCLLTAAHRLSSRQYLVGEQFSAADLTLAALSRPVLLVPFFRDHPRLQALWNWRATQLRAHRRDPHAGYEKTLRDIRQRRGWELGEVRWLSGLTRDDLNVSTEIPHLAVASNDQQSVGSWAALAAPLGYLRLKLTSGLGRTAYSAQD